MSENHFYVYDTFKWTVSVGNRLNWFVYKNDDNRAIRLWIEQHIALMTLNDSAID